MLLVEIDEKITGLSRSLLTGLIQKAEAEIVLVDGYVYFIPGKWTALVDDCVRKYCI